MVKVKAGIARSKEEVLYALYNIFDGEIDADWSGDNDEVYWPDAAREAGKPMRDLVDEELREVIKEKDYTPEEIVRMYIERYRDELGGYYTDYDYKVDEVFEGTDDCLNNKTYFVIAVGFEIETTW